MLAAALLGHGRPGRWHLLAKGYRTSGKNCVSESAGDFQIGRRRAVHLAAHTNEHEKLGKRDQAIANAKAALVIYRTTESPTLAKVEAWLRKRGIEP
jgi:hypothetical protein